MAAKQDVKSNVLSQSLRRDPAAPQSWVKVNTDLSTDGVLLVPDPATGKPICTDCIPKTPSPLPLTDEQKRELFSLYTSGKGAEVARIRKFTDYVLNGQPVASSASTPATNLSLIAQGTQPYQRIGNTLKLTRGHLKCRINWAVQGIDYKAQEPHPVRLIVFIDRMPVIDVPTLATDNLLTANGDISALLITESAGAAFNTIAHWNPNTHGTRYHILHDRVYNPLFIPVYNSTGITSRTEINFDEFFDINVMQQYVSETSTFTSLITNSVNLIAFVDNDVESSIQASISYIYRYYWEDVEA